MLLDKLLSNLAVQVEPFALCQLSEGWRLSLPCPPEVMFHFVLKGHGAVRGPGRTRYPVGPYWLAIVPAGSTHALESSDDPKHERRIDAPPEGVRVPTLVAGSPENPDMTVACGLVRIRYGPSLGLFDHLRNVLVVDLSDSPQVLTAFQGILAEQSKSGPGSEAMTTALMSQCLVHLLRSLGSGGDCPLPWLAALEDPRLARAVDRILEDPGADYTVDSLADVASMSRSAFAERFSTAFGRTPMNLVHHVRMQNAAQLLGQGDALSVDEVARRVGFSSRSHFSQAFKKHCGVSPNAYRGGQLPEKAGGV